MGDLGKVEVRIDCSDDRSKIKIFIQDNGKGIPTEVLERVGSRGYSFDKTEASGLGLFHARSSIGAMAESCGFEDRSIAA
jgi:signal transduction histidine kinase